MAGSDNRKSVSADGISGTTKVIQALESRESALKAGELAKLLGVTRQHIYKMAASGILPCFKVGAAVRFDPRQVADWLRMRMPRPVTLAPVHKPAV